jgi:hypothetical protein
MVLEKTAYRKRPTETMSQINGLQGREVLCSSKGNSANSTCIGCASKCNMTDCFCNADYKLLYIKHVIRRCTQVRTETYRGCFDGNRNGIPSAFLVLDSE